MRSIVVAISLIFGVVGTTQMPHECYAALAKIKIRFKIKTDSGSIIGVTIEGRDKYECEYKLKRRYPGCEILRAEKLK